MGFLEIKFGAKIVILFFWSWDSDFKDVILDFAEEDKIIIIFEINKTEWQSYLSLLFRVAL